MLVLVKTKRNIATMRETMLEAAVQNNPRLLLVEDVLRDFFAKYLNWDRVRDRFVAIYKEAFTEKELRTIITFYKTEVGQKAIERLPGLMRRGSQIGQKIVREHRGELHRKLQEALEETEKPSDESPGKHAAPDSLAGPQRG